MGAGQGELSDVDVAEVNEIGAEKVVANIECRMEALVDFFVDQSEAMIHGDLEHLTLWNEYVFHGEVDDVVSIWLEVEMSLKDNTLTLESLSITDVRVDDV